MMSFLKKIFKREKAPFKLDGRKLILTMSDGSIEERHVPGRWENVTVDQVIELQKAADDLAPIDLFCIMMGVKKELAYMIDLDIITSVGESFAFMSDAQALAKSFKPVPEDYKSKDFGKLMFGVVYQCQLLVEQENMEPWQDLEARKKITELVLGISIGDCPYCDWLNTMDFFYNASLNSTKSSKESTRRRKTRLLSKSNTGRFLVGLWVFIILFIASLIMMYVCGMTYIVYRLIEYLCCS